MGGATHWSGRATRARLLLERCLVSIFLWMPSSQKKIYALFFPYFSEAAAEVEPFFDLRKGRSAVAASGKSLPSSPPTPPWRGEENLHQHLHQHNLHLKIQRQLPHTLW
jgi:hypothetical protein